MNLQTIEPFGQALITLLPSAQKDDFHNIRGRGTYLNNLSSSERIDAGIY